MNSLISLINKIQEILSISQVKFNINLPQIICVGSQSSGKTSIIESIVGKDFLPKGSGIITRRPLILQLKYQKSGDDYCEFLHKAGQKIADFSQVANEIINETNRVAGRSKLISDVPIILKIFSTNLVDLTLVDLPGLVNVALSGQPDNIDTLVKKIVLDFISNPNAIILAITPANIDIANSASLKIAKEVDPYFTRTLGVISKLDLVENHADVVNIINNTVYPLKYGYIGVTCRNSKENFSNKTIDVAIKEEEETYQNINEYKPLLKSLGIKKLTARLTEVLTSKIKKCIPSIKENLSDAIYKKENELNALGSEIAIEEDDNVKVNSFVLACVFNYTSSYKKLINGSIVNPDLNKIYIGAAKINKIFTETFKNEIASIDPFDKLTSDEILIVIKNTNGLKPSLFVPETAFEVLIRQQIKRLEDPSLLCVKRVYDELLNTLDIITVSELSRFKKLELKIKELMTDVINRCLQPTNEMIKNLIDIELSYINSSHPDFLSNGDLNQKDEGLIGDDDKKKENEKINAIKYSSRENMEINIIKSLLVSYFNVVKKTICDMVPKTIMCFLVNKTKEISEQNMIEEIYKSDESIKKLLEEDPAVAEKRKELKEQLKFLKGSLEVLNTEVNQ